MNINIGETISTMRKEKALTQEQLSEVFGVSVAAVSKWETGIAYPDIELLPKIAGFFDVSVDRLLGYDMSKLGMNIDEWLKKVNVLLAEQKGTEALSILGNLAYKYPNNVNIIVKYAKVKYQSVHGNPRNENHRKLFKEAEDMLLSINRNGLARQEYDSIMGALSDLYLWDKKFDKAEKILNELNSDGPDFWFYIHKGEMEKARKKYYSLLEKTFLNDALIYGNYHAFYDNPEKVIDLNDKLIKMIQIFTDDLPAYPDKTLSILHESNAFMHARLGKKDESLAEIAKLMEFYGDSYESFIKLINCDERKEYELVKNTDEFKKLTEKLK
ncbi:MAG: helix-turn-helix domain-containing protein [Oscillospiraceae bacterium]|nr:helix-turn-helix domain-containing protein [Oscillospiraceae bacterium]